MRLRLVVWRSSRVQPVQQGVQHVHAQGSRALHEMARLFDALAPADVAQQFQQRALWRAPVQRVFNVCDDTELTMGDYFDLAADLYGLPRPPRVSRASAQQQLPLSLLSFMGESRRLSNQRMKRELRLVLRYPTVAQGLAASR